MSALIKRLEKLICHPDGTRRLGAMSRVAEKLGVSHGAIINWIGGGVPSAENVGRIKALLADKTFAPTKRKSGVPKGAKTWYFGAKREHVYAGK